MSSEAAQYDVIVIGGGINGAAIAREAVLSGLSVLIIERDDLCCGTSAAATRLIHGGLRYLEHAELGLVYESLAEREQLLKTASHLVEPFPFYVPVFAESRRSKWKVKAGMLLYDLLSIGKSVPGHSMLNAAELSAALPSLRRENLRGGALYYDAQITFPERLVIELVQDAVDNGAQLMTHTAVTSIDVTDGRVSAVEYRGTANGRATAKVIINASGPWVDQVAGVHARHRLIGGTRGSHLVIAPFVGLPGGAVYSEAASDGRPFFVVPWNGMCLIGTTDERYQGDPADVTVTPAERDYLLAETHRLLPGAGDLSASVCYGYAGIRALPYQPSGAESAITRRHIIHAHRDAAGLYSIVGGKLTTHRALAVDVLKRLRRHFPQLPRKSPTLDRNTPGCLLPDERRELSAALTSRFDAQLADRLLRIYGANAARLLQLCDESREYSMVITPRSGLLVAELVYAKSAQWAQSLIDILQRRCMAGLSADAGLGCVDAAGQWLIRLGLSDRSSALEQISAYRDWVRRIRGVQTATVAESPLL